MPFMNVWETGGLYRVFFGDVTAKEVVESNLALHGDPRFDDIHYVLNDFLNVSGVEVKEEELNEIVVFDGVATLTKKHLKIALVTNSEPLKIWINLYCEKMAKTSYECRIFETNKCARAWVE